MVQALNGIKTGIAMKLQLYHWSWLFVLDASGEV